MTVIFISVDQKVLYSVICKNTDLFSDIEKLLYKEYPERGENEARNYFIANGVKLNRYKTLQENEIKNSNVITLKEMDDII